MTGWKHQAARALMVWFMTYASGVIILLIIHAEHPFVMALLPTLATVYSSIGIVKDAIRATRANAIGKRTIDMTDPAE
jgi:hypothetical protein